MGRKYSIDVLRVVSALAVITIHVVSGPAFNYSGSLDQNVISILNGIHNMMNWSVPVFFMITGYCILRKDTYTYRQSFVHVMKYICVLMTVGFFYALLEQVAAAKTVNTEILINSVRNVIAGKLWDHMWYVYEIIGIYLVIPVIHQYMQSGKRNRLILTGLLFAFTIIIPAVDRWMEIGISIPFGGYLFYVCFGGIVAKHDFGRKEKICMIWAALLSVVWIMLYDKNVSFHYQSIPVCMIAGGIFLTAADADMKPSRFVETVSQCTWGMYLIHPFFMNVAIKVLSVDLFSSDPWFRLSVFWLVICCISFASTYVLRKIPLVQKLF